MNEEIFELQYLYRDAGNYKFRGRIFIAGGLCLTQLRRFLIWEEFFIPEKIGLPDLRPTVRNDDDHLLHEFEEVVLATEGRPQMTAKDLGSRIKTASKNGWFNGYA